MEYLFKNFTFNAGNDIIKNNFTIKILGTIIQADLKLDKTINKLSSELHNKIYNIRKLTPFTNFKTRYQFLNAFVFGKLNYIIPIYSIATQVNISKLHKIVMTSARAAIGNYCCRKSTAQILSTVKWLSIITSP